MTAKYFFAALKKIWDKSEKFVGILALTFSVLDPLQTSNQLMQLNVSLFAASEKVLMGKAY